MTVYRPVVKMVPVVQPCPQIMPSSQGQSDYLRPDRSVGTGCLVWKRGRREGHAALVLQRHIDRRLECKRCRGSRLQQA